MAGGLNLRLLKQDEQFDINHRKSRRGLMSLMADRQHTETPYEPWTTWGIDSGTEFNPQRQTGNVYQYVGCILGQGSILWVHKLFDRMPNTLKLAVAAVATQTHDLHMTYNPFNIQETNKQAFKMYMELMNKTNKQATLPLPVHFLPRCSWKCLPQLFRYRLIVPGGRDYVGCWKMGSLFL